MLNVTGVAGSPTKAAQTHALSSDGVSLRTIIGILLRRASVIALVIAVAITLAILYLFVAQSKYTATASLIPDLKRDPGSPTEVTRETLIDPAIVENQIETIRSKTISLAVIDKLALWKDPEFVGTGPGLLTRALRFVGLSGSEESGRNVVRERAAASFAQMLKVTRVGRSYVTEISVTSIDPAKAAVIANEVTDAYIQEQLGARFFNAERSGRWMQQRIAELSQQSTSAAKTIDDFKATTNLRLDANGRPAILRESERLATSLNQATAETAKLNARNEQFQSALRDENRNMLPDTVVLDSINDSAVARLREDYRAAQSSAAQAPTNPSQQTGTADQDAKLSEQRNAIWDATRSAAETARTDLEAARLRDAAILRQVQDLAPQLEGAQQNADKLKQLDSQYQNYRQLQASLENRFARLKDFVQQQSLPVTEARVVAEATPPLRPSSPKLGLVLLLAAAAGVTLGAAAAFALEFFDRTLRRPEQVENDLGLWSLGTVRRFNRTEIARQSALSRGGGGLLGPQLALSINDWLSGANGETLRYIKVTLDEGLRPKGARTFAVISPNTGEGKTAVALGLAMLMARGGKRTLLIDADMREPSLTRALQPSAVSDTAFALGSPLPIIEGGTQRELSFHFLAIPRSQHVHPSEALSSQAIAEMLQQLRAQYDYIVVDTAALKPYVDVAASATLFDAFVMVAEAGRTTLDDINHSLVRSSVISERLLGVLINKCRPTESRFERFLARGRSFAGIRREARA